MAFNPQTIVRRPAYGNYPPRREEQGIGTAFKSGLSSAVSAVRGGFNIFTGDNEDALEQAINLRDAPKTEAQQRFMAEIQQRADESDVSWLDGFKNVIGAAWAEPKGAWHEFIAQLPNSGVALGGMFAGARTGAAIGSYGGPQGTAIGTIVGGITGLFASNTLLETGFLSGEAAMDNQFTDDEMRTVRRQGLVKGATISGVDVATLGLGRAIAGVPGRAVENAVRKSLSDQGIDIASEAAIKSAMASPSVSERVIDAGISALNRTMTRAGRGSRNTVQFSLESVGEATGEYLGSSLAGLEASPTDAIMEGLMSVPQSITEISLSKRLTDRGKFTRLFDPENTKIRTAAEQRTVESVTAPEKTVDESIDAAAAAIDETPIEPVDFEPLIRPIQFEPITPAEMAFNKLEREAAQQKARDYDLALTQRIEQDVQRATRETEKQELLDRYSKDNPDNNIPNTAIRDALLASFLKLRIAETDRREASAARTEKTRFPDRPDQILDLRSELSGMQQSLEALEDQIKTARGEKGTRTTLAGKVAELGGVSIEEGRSEGVLDVNEMRNGRWIFTKKGMTLDEMAERLNEEGYQFLDSQGNVDKNAFLDALDDSVRGLTSEMGVPGMEDLTALEMERDMLEEGIGQLESALYLEMEGYHEFTEGKIPLNNAIIAEADDGTFTYQEKLVAEAMLAAFNAGMSQAEAEALLQEQINDDYQAYVNFRGYEFDATQAQNVDEGQATETGQSAGTVQKGDSAEQPDPAQEVTPSPAQTAPNSDQFELVSQTEESLSQDAARLKEIEEAKAAEEAKYAKPKENNFRLTGSNRPADIAAAAGQTDITDVPPEQNQDLVNKVRALQERLIALRPLMDEKAESRVDRERAQVESLIEGMQESIDTGKGINDPEINWEGLSRKIDKIKMDIQKKPTQAEVDKQEADIAKKTEKMRADRAEKYKKSGNLIKPFKSILDLPVFLNEHSEVDILIDLNLNLEPVLEQAEAARKELLKAGYYDTAMIHGSIPQDNLQGLGGSLSRFGLDIKSLIEDNKRSDAMERIGRIVRFANKYGIKIDILRAENLGKADKDEETGVRLLYAYGTLKDATEGRGFLQHPSNEGIINSRDEIQIVDALSDESVDKVYAYFFPKSKGKKTTDDKKREIGINHFRYQIKKALEETLSDTVDTNESPWNPEKLSPFWGFSVPAANEALASVPGEMKKLKQDLMKKSRDDLYEQAEGEGIFLIGEENSEELIDKLVAAETATRAMTEFPHTHGFNDYVSAKAGKDAKKKPAPLFNDKDLRDWSQKVTGNSSKATNANAERLRIWAMENDRFFLPYKNPERLNPGEQQSGSTPITEPRGKKEPEDTVHWGDSEEVADWIEVDPSLPEELKESFQRVYFQEDRWSEAPPKTTNLEERAKEKGFKVIEKARAQIEEWKKEATSEQQKLNRGKVIVSLFDFSGKWSEPYAKSGYDVWPIDIQGGNDIRDLSVEWFADNMPDATDVYGVIAACPCTDFTVSGAAFWEGKDMDGRTMSSVELVDQTIATVEYLKPHFWVIENPLGRLPQMTGGTIPTAQFQPHNFGDPYTKKTYLWGRFNPELPLNNVQPTEGSKVQSGMGSGDHNARSETPTGFAYAFWKANNFATSSDLDKLLAEYPGPIGAYEQALYAGVPYEHIRALVGGIYEYNEPDSVIGPLSKYTAAWLKAKRNGLTNAEIAYLIDSNYKKGDSGSRYPYSGTDWEIVGDEISEAEPARVVTDEEVPQELAEADWELVRLDDGNQAYRTAYGNQFMSLAEAEEWLKQGEESEPTQPDLQPAAQPVEPGQQSLLDEEAAPVAREEKPETKSQYDWQVSKPVPEFVMPPRRIDTRKFETQQRLAMQKMTDEEIKRIATKYPFFDLQNITDDVDEIKQRLVDLRVMAELSKTYNTVDAFRDGWEAGKLNLEDFKKWYAAINGKKALEKRMLQHKNKRGAATKKKDEDMFVYETAMGFRERTAWVLMRAFPLKSSDQYYFGPPDLSAFEGKQPQWQKEWEALNESGAKSLRQGTAPETDDMFAESRYREQDIEQTADSRPEAQPLTSDEINRGITIAEKNARKTFVEGDIVKTTAGAGNTLLMSGGTFRVTSARKDYAYIVSNDGGSLTNPLRMPIKQLISVDDAAAVEAERKGRENLTLRQKTDVESLDGQNSRSGRSNAGKPVATAEQQRINNRGRKPILGRITALGIAEEVEEYGTAYLIGKQVDSPSKLAELAQVFRDPRYETTRWFFTKGNEIVHATGVTVRLPGATALIPESADGDFEGWLREQVERSGANGWYVMHNHPDGDPTPSEADIETTKKIANAVPGFKGHVVINSGKYAVIDNKGDAKSATVFPLPKEDKLLAPSIPSDALGAQIKTRAELASLGKRMQKEGYITVIASSNDGVRGIVELDAKKLAKKGVAQEQLSSIAIKTGSYRLLLWGTEGALESLPMRELVEKGYVMDAAASDTPYQARRKYSRDDNYELGEVISGPDAISGVVVQSNKDNYSLDDTDEIMASKLGLGGSDGSSFIRKIKELKERNFRDLLREILSRFREGVFDGLNALKRVEEDLRVGIGNGDYEGSAYVGARLATGISDVIHGLLHYGGLRWGDGVTQYKDGTVGLLSIFDELGEDVNNWLGWMAGNRGAELSQTDRENNLSQSDIEKLIALAEGKEEKFEDARQKYLALQTSVLDYAQEAGLIDPVRRNQWESEWYVPFYRRSEIDGDANLLAPRTKRGLSHQTAAIRALTGKNVPTNDLLQNILTNWTTMVDASMKNMALSKVVTNLDGSEYISDETVQWTRYPISRSEINKQIRQDRKLQRAMASALGLDETADYMKIINDLTKLDNDDFMRLWGPMAPRDPDVIRLQVGGKNQYYRVHDASVLRAIHHLGNTGSNDVVTRSARWFKRLLTTGVTTSPDFMIRNFVRDAVHAWAINPDGFRLGRDSLRGLKDARKESEFYKVMMFGGASFQGGYVHGTDPEASAQIIRRALKKKGYNDRQINAHMKSLVDTPEKLHATLESMWQKYRAMGDKIENANRLATFTRAMESQKSLAQALYEAKDLMDYSMRGNHQAMMWLVDVVPFLNARLQGLYKLGRAGKANPAEVGWAVSQIAMFSVALAMLNEDDDDYQQLPDWEKDAYWHFYMGGDHWRVPKPFEIGLFGASMPERMYMAWVADVQPDSAVKEAFKHGVFETLRFNPLPQALIPAIEAWGNRSFYFDRPIEGTTDQTRLPEDRFNAYTSTMMVKIGSILGASPKMLQHLWEGYTGTMGAYALQIADSMVRAVETGTPPRPELTAQDIPVLKSFYRGSGTPRMTQDATEFYDRLNEVNQIYNSWRDRQQTDPASAAELREKEADKLRVRRLLTTRSRLLSDLRKQRDRVMNSLTIPPAEKTARLDRINQQINKSVQQVVELTNEAFDEAS